MIWAIDFRDTSGVAKRLRIRGAHSWLSISRIADRMTAEGCVVSRIEVIRFTNHAKEA